MSERLIARMIGPLGRAVANMVARGSVALANAATKMQTLQLRLLSGEVKDGVEHFEPYGFTSCPKPGAEALVLFLGGDRSHGVAVAVGDRRYRLVGLDEGEVALFDDLGHKVHLTRGGIVVDGAGHVVTIQNTPDLVVDGLSFKHHVHGGVAPGGGTTGEPQ